jgi:hypothetical protein
VDVRSDLYSLGSWFLAGPFTDRARLGRLRPRMNFLTRLSFGSEIQIKKPPHGFGHDVQLVDGQVASVPCLEQVLDSPELVEVDPTDPELTHLVGRIKEHGNRALRVVFNNSAKPVRIVTVYFDRKLKDRL